MDADTSLSPVCDEAYWTVVRLLETDHQSAGRGSRRLSKRSIA